jgi:hypothetical protein
VLFERVEEGLDDLALALAVTIHKGVDAQALGIAKTR